LRAKAVFLNAERLEVLEHDLEVGEGQSFILDNAEAFLPRYQTALFHLFNLIQSKKGSLLLTTSTHPKDWPVTLKDLSSRLATLPLFTLEAPDDLLFLSILAKNFSDYQMQVSPKVLEFIMKHVPRTFENIHAIPKQLNTASLSQHHAVTIPFVKEILGL
jgi:chromosomal replication initiation ATPase DnaA